MPERSGTDLLDFHSDPDKNHPENHTSANSPQGELALAYRRFDRAVDPELVESCVYHISAVKARCNYLIRAIKERSPEALAAARPEETTVWI